MIYGMASHIMKITVNIDKAGRIVLPKPGAQATVVLAGTLVKTAAL
jgi:hypothetical protein